MNEDTAAELYIDGRLVTERNASRFVKARRPNAAARRETQGGWIRKTYYLVSDRSGGASWCHATGATAGKAWLRAAQLMVAHDLRVAEEDEIRRVALAELLSAKFEPEIVAAALRYAAVRLEQASWTSGGQKDMAVLLRKLSEQTP